jgi:hypothetical protein
MAMGARLCRLAHSVLTGNQFQSQSTVHSAQDGLTSFTAITIRPGQRRMKCKSTIWPIDPRESDRIACRDRGFRSCSSCRRPRVHRPNFSVRGLRAPPQEIGSLLILRPPEQIRQLRDVDRDAPRLVLGQPLHRYAPTGLILEIYVTKRLTLSVATQKLSLASSACQGGVNARRSDMPHLRTDQEHRQSQGHARCATLVRLGFDVSS